MVLPFGIGAGLAVTIHNGSIDPTIKFTRIVLFTGVEDPITALLVLTRFSIEMDTTAGVVVLLASVGNDISTYNYRWSSCPPPAVGWTLSALSIALMNAGLGLTVVYIRLVRIGWALFRLFPVKLAIRWLAKATASIESGPSLFP